MAPLRIVIIGAGDDSTLDKAIIFTEETEDHFLEAQAERDAGIGAATCLASFTVPQDEENLVRDAIDLDMIYQG